MSSDKSPQNLFNEALDRADPVERTRFLDDACGADTALRERVEKLLRAHDEAGGFFSQPSKASASQASYAIGLPVTEKPGDKIGRYKLLQQIGEGGCGVVYMAEQEEPVRRRVALKVIKLGMDTKQVIARFEAERQALALMDHPNIARVLDAGATETGRPFFVMELVRGVKITEFCDENKLSTEDRLKLFMQVCQAIQHAHQKGVIHRDIKPSNILVTINDDVPVPKVIDFGIAKATAGRLTNQTLFTAFEQFIGTPAYMSPEQAVMTSLDIDTRSDIYSLGVLLYELLTGSPPFDQKELLAVGLDEMRRTIREVEPVKPSTRLTQELVAAPRQSAADSAAENGRALPRRRYVETQDLIHALRGDLDWIAMKCLEKDRARRYETANALAADIQRHLSCEPVVARPPSRLYEFQKTVRRHKFGFAATLALFTVLLGGIFTSSLQALRATRAEHQQAQLREQAERAAILEAEQRRRVEELAEENRQNLYAARINQAWGVFQEGDAPRVLELLGSLVPAPRESDLRGFEWYYLWRLCHSEKFNLIGHVGPVRSVSFSPDGLTLASVGDDMIIRLWDTRTGKQESAIVWPHSWITSVAFSPDGKWLAAGSSNSTVGLWEAGTGKLRHTFEGHTNPVRVVKFSPDGSLLASATSEVATGRGNPSERFLGRDFGRIPGELKLWDLRTMQERMTLKGHSKGIIDLAFSPDGKLLASAGIDRALRVWNVSTEEPVAAVTNFAGPVFSLGFAPDGKGLAAVGGYPHNLAAEIRFWDLPGFTEVSRLHEEVPLTLSMSFTPDGKSLVCAGKNRIVRLLDLASGRTRRIFGGHTGFVQSVAVSPDGSTLASGDWDGVIKLWDTTKSLETEPFAGRETGCFSVVFSPDATLLAVAGSRAIGVWDVATGKQYLSGSMKGGDVIVAISGDGSTLAAVGTEGVIELWNLETREHLRSLTNRVGKQVWSMAFSPDSQMLAGGRSRAIDLWDLRSGTLVATLGRHTSPVRNMAFTPDGRTLYSGSDHELKSWNMGTLREQMEIAGPSGAVDISPDGRLLASGHFGPGTIRKCSDLREVATLRGHREKIWGIAFSPDGKTLATSSWDQTVRLWQVATGRELMSFNARGGVAWSVAFSPDSKFLAFGSGSYGKGEVSLVRAATKAEVLLWEAAELKAKAIGK